MLGFYPGSILPGKISLPEDKAAADKKAAEEKMEIERGVRLLDTSTDDISSQDRKRSRVDSLSSHFIKVCGLGTSEVFEMDDSNHPLPPSMAPLSSANIGLPHSCRMARTAARRNMMTASLAGVGPYRIEKWLRLDAATAVVASSCQMMRDSSLSRTFTAFTTK